MAYSYKLSNGLTYTLGGWVRQQVYRTKNYLENAYQVKSKQVKWRVELEQRTLLDKGIVSPGRVMVAIYTITLSNGEQDTFKIQLSPPNTHTWYFYQVSK